MPENSTSEPSAANVTYEGVLFDLDGTLLDTAKDLGNALNHVLNAKGLPACPYNIYRPYASNGSKGLLELGFGEKFTEFDQQALIAMFLNFYEANVCVQTCLFEGVELLIRQLNARQIPWGIVTNKPGYLTDKLLPHFDIFDKSIINVSGDTLPKRKPDPAPLIFAADKMGIAPERILYVGDAERDITAANQANMASVTADYGYIKAGEDTKLWQGKYAISQPEQLLTWLSC